MDFRKKNLQDLQIKNAFNVNTRTGKLEGSVSLPLVSGRDDFGPQIYFQYSSGGGNSEFGLGWSLVGTPYISLSKRDGLPKYDGSDSYAYNGGLSLVPKLKKEGTEWVPEITENTDYWIYYFIGNIEQNSIRFEKWVKKTDHSVHWRSRSKSNVLSIYGQGGGKIFNPEKESNIYKWLIEAQYDSKGNAILYKYKAENDENINPEFAFEITRLKNANEYGFAQRYLERIQYANSLPILPDEDVPVDNKWHFEVVFDYGEYIDEPFESSLPSLDSFWDARMDSFSRYSGGFEVRNYRLCKRLLFYNNIIELSNTSSLTGIFSLVHNESALGSTIKEMRYVGVRRDLHSNTYKVKEAPHLTFEYSEPSIGDSFKATIKESLENVPQGISSGDTTFIDLFGEGLSGILTETKDSWYYKSNLGNGKFDAQSTVINKPIKIEGAYALGDFDNNGNLDVFALVGRTAGYYEYDRNNNSWSGFKNFKQIPQVSNFKFMDTNSNGFADLVVQTEDKIVCFPFEDKDGFGDPFEISKPISNGIEYSPTLGDDHILNFHMADMTGDGMLDQLEVKNGRVGYYPNLGHGRFGSLVLMEDPPLFDFEFDFDPARVRFYDLDGSGTSDIIYIGRGFIKYWYNASGNKFIEGGTKFGLPFIDNLSSVSILNYLGNGTPCLVWSSNLGYQHEYPIQYLELTNGIVPRLMVSVNNGCGWKNMFEYTNSGIQFLNAKSSDRPWITKIPRHFTVVDKKIAEDTINNSKAVTQFKFYDGHYDSNESTFVCFGRVEQYDRQLFSDFSMTSDVEYVQPNLTIQWFHPGLLVGIRKFQMHLIMRINIMFF